MRRSSSLKEYGLFGLLKLGPYSFSHDLIHLLLNLSVWPSVTGFLSKPFCIQLSCFQLKQAAR